MGSLSVSRAGEPSIAVAFGGGGARGLAHIHVIEALDELGLQPVAISGSSIGAIMGAGMASGMSGRDIGDYASEVLTRKTEVLSRIWRAQRTNFSGLMENGWQFGGLNAERILKQFLPAAIPETFEALKLPLYVTGTDFYGSRQAVFNSGDIISALGASIALPAMFQPVYRDNTMLIDGGIYNPLPYDLLRGMADIVIAVDVVGVPSPNGGKTPGSIDLLLGASQLMMHSAIENRLLSERPDILLRPNVGRFRVHDFLKMSAIMEETVAIKDELKRRLDAAITVKKAG